jgi:hypothetical protein
MLRSPPSCIAVSSRACEDSRLPPARCSRVPGRRTRSPSSPMVVRRSRSSGLALTATNCGRAPARAPQDPQHAPRPAGCPRSVETDTRNELGLNEYVVVHGRARITEGGAPELLQRLAHVYLGPEVKFPRMADPPRGYITRGAGTGRRRQRHQPDHHRGPGRHGPDAAPPGRTARTPPGARRAVGGSSPPEPGHWCGPDARRCCAGRPCAAQATTTSSSGDAASRYLASGRPGRAPS